MSQRGKRPNSIGIEGSSSIPVKRRKGRPPTTVSVEAEELVIPSTSTGCQSSSAATWQARPHLDLKMSSIYNRSAPEAPAELFRKDLISAMKLPDSEPLSHDEYWVINDQWKQEWERGVQVPVNPDSLPEPIVRSLNENYYKGRQDFKLPKNKYIRITKDENFSHDKNYLSNTPALADSVCSYDLDQCDEAWLKEFNGERSLCGLPNVNEEQFERIVEELETRCYDKIQAIMKSEEGLGIEYDENVICDVCRSPDSEEANEMVFCDNCNICVHQACYGITTIPSGQWLCRTCSMGQKPDCVLCPNKGGAMKSTRSGQKWAHVSCALWIPEVSIGSVDRMEPITKISSIPQSRWALLCVLCRERVGACIQCSVKTCKTAYHVTCAFQHGLEMRAIIEDENAEDGVKLRSYCQKHSVNNKNKKDPKTSANNNIEKDISSNTTNTTTTATTTSSTTTSTTTTTITVPPTEDEEKTCKKRIRKEMTSEERNQARMARLQEIEGEFDKHVSIRDISCHLLDVDQEGINHIYSYWILKRKAGGNKPLLLPKTEDVDVLTQTDQEQADIEKMKMFVHLRQDLERVRNLCYMVSRREKLSRSFFKMREQIFHKQMAVLSRNKNTNKLDENVIDSIVEANHGPSIYDVLYSSDTIIKDQTKQIKIEVMIDSILGNNLNSKSNTSNKLATDINGSTKKMDASSRYSKIFNGGTGSGANRKYSLSDSLSSDTDNSSRRRRNRRKMGHNNSSSAASTSSATTDDEGRVTRKSPVKFTKPSPVPAASPVVKKKVGRPSLKATENKKRKTNSVNSSAEKNKSYSMDSSSEDDLKQSMNSKQQKTPVALSAAKPRTTKVRQRDDNDDENNMHLTDESDELIPIKNSSGYNIPTTANIKRIESSAIYSDSDDSSSSDKDNKTDHTVSDSQQQPLRTKAAMKEFKVKTTALTTPVKARRASTKLTTWSDSEKEDEEKETVVKIPVSSKEKEPTNATNHKKNASKKEKDQHTDLLVVPQREAAKKASENLMKTNSALMVQSISATNTEKHRKDAREKLDETLLLKNISDSERENQKQAKEVTPKRNKSSKDTKKSTNKEEKKQKEREKEEADREKQREKEEADREKQREKDDKLQNEIPSDVHAYVPQRQAAKKAAEHIKGLGKPGDTSQVQAVASFDEKEKEKSKTTPSTPVSSKKREIERRKSTVIDLSSSSTSSSSSNSDSGSSGSSDSGEADSPKTKIPVKVHATTSANKTPTSTAGSKLKTKDSPFLDKVPKSSATVPTSSSSDSSSDSDSSASDRPSSTRLPDKSRTSSKKKSVGESVLSTKKQSNVVSSNKKSSSTTKVENDKLLSPPPRRSSNTTKSNASASTKRTETEKASTPSRRKSMAVSVDQEQTNSRTTSKTTTTKVSSNKSKTTESSKGDLVKLSDKRKPSTDVKEIATPPRTSDTLNKKRKSSINVLPSSPNHLSSDKEPKIDSKAAKENKEKHPKDKEISSEVVFRRSSRSDSMASKVTNISSSTTTVAIENKIDSPLKQKEVTSAKMKPPPPSVTMKIDSSPDVIEIADESESEVPIRNVRNNNKSILNEKKIESKDIKDSAMEIDDEAIVDAVNVVNDDKVTKEDSPMTPNDIKVTTPLPSPVHSQKTSSTLSMVSIPTANLNLSKDNDSNSIGDLGNDLLENAAAISAEINQVFGDEAFNRIPSFLNAKDPFMVNKEDAKEDTERETYNLIEKLRQKNKKLGSSNSITENNNTISDKTPNRDFHNEQSPSLLVKASPNDRNVLKSNENTNKSSPCANNRVITNKTTPQHEGFEQQLQMKMVQDNCPQITKKEHNQMSSPYIQQQNQSNENNFNLNRNLTNTTNNSHKQNVSLSGNNILSPTSTSLPPSTTCMVVEQQQKQQQQMQRMGEENCLAASNPFMTPLQMMLNPNDQMNSALNPMDMFNMHLQQQEQNQKWQPNAEQLKSKLKMLQQHHPGAASYNMLKRNQDIDNMLGDQQHQLHHQKQNIGNDYSGLGNMQANYLQNSFHYTDNAPQYPGAVSLFPPSGMNVQVPFPSPGQAMFPPNFGNSFSSSSTHQNTEHSMMMHKVNADLIANSNNLQYGAQNLCGTASSFTSQQHQESVLSMIQKATQEQTMIRNLSPPSFTSNKKNDTDRRNSSEKQTRQSESKRSPMKSTRASPRNTTPTHNKTPQKSPSKSPRQPPTVEPVYARQSSGNGKNKVSQSTENSKQKKGRANSQASPASTGTPTSTSGRGKGRGRGRGRGGAIVHQQPFMQPINDFDFNSMGTINQKLVGTVYDFSADDEIMHPGVENLRAMRDRRKSVDLYNKMNRDGSTTTASESPKFSSKSSMKSSLAVNNHTMTNNIITPVPSSTLPDMNLVNMPGPVDMRTYSTNFDTNDNNYNSQLLGAFATNTVDQTLNEIDEEQEKELQTALKASNDKQKTPTTTTVIETPTNVEVINSSIVEQHVEESVDSDASFPKVSLSDSRNQLKLKIKGPLAHPDIHHTHSTSSLLTQQQAEVNPHHQILVTPQANITGGSSNRRMPQMRKKELLRQYWTQDMNMDHEQSSIMQSVDQTINMTINTQTSRIAGIPKAVDSMGSYLMKDDYKEINYAEFKKRKKISMRELRQLDIYPMDVADMAASGDLSENNDDEDPLSITTKRRNRPTRGAQLNNLSLNPPSKLKIKIGPDMMETMGAGGDLPPKKRLSNTTTRPNFVDLKRESMNFRKQMMVEFGENKKKEHRTKEEKRERKEKKKKKKKDKKREMEIISQPSDAPTKLIIRIGNKSTTTTTSSPKNSTSTSTHSTDIANNSNTIDNLNKSIPITPLRLKIARNSQGNGQSYTLSTKESTVVNSTDKSIDNFSIQSPMTTTIIEGAKMVTSTPLNNTSNNNNLSILQPPIIDASSINTLTTKKLEVTLNRIDDVIGITKPTLASKKQMTQSTPSNDDVANLTTPASNSIAHKDCEVR
ncbi:unnamed protein product [Diamesa serratosioi]